MPSTVTTPALPEGTLWTPAITADLLPSEISEARRGRRVRDAVIAGLLVVALLTTAWYALTALQTAIANQDLADATAAAGNLRTEEQSFAAVIDAQNRTQRINTELLRLLADDRSWSTVLAQLRAAAPLGITLSSANAELAAAAPDAGPGGLPGTAGEAPIGTITITGTGRTKSNVADYLGRLDRVPGFDRPTLDSATGPNGGMQFTIRVTITDKAPGGRFAPSPAATGGP